MIHNEEVLFRGAANLKKGIEAVGGNLEITDQRILFESHRINIQTGVTSILLDHVLSYKLTNKLFVIPNGLTIITKKGIEYKFVVSKRKDLVKVLDNAINKN